MNFHTCREKKRNILTYRDKKDRRNKSRRLINRIAAQRFWFVDIAQKIHLSVATNFLSAKTFIVGYKIKE